MGLSQLRSDMRVCLMSEEIQGVDEMAHEMLKKLYSNRDKRHWSEFSQKWLLNRLRQETSELTRAVEAGKPEDIIREAADVANFAMMIADNARASAAEKGGEKDAS